MKKAVVITGVSTGIGFELSKVFVKNEFHVFGSVRTPRDAERLQVTLGGAFTPLLFDVTDSEAIAQAAYLVEQKLDGVPLSGLINNAGIAVSGPLLELPLEDFKRQFDVNLFGLISVTQAFAPLLGAKKDFHGSAGRILNISSAAGKIGFPFLGPYCGSKHAVEGISESLRRELMHLGIKVIIIGPTAIKTPIWEKEGAEVEKDILDGLFGKQVGNFIKLFAKSGKRGMPTDEFARRVYNIFELKNPKVRYAISGNPFAEWMMPRYLPSKMVDKNLEKVLNK